MLPVKEEGNQARWREKLEGRQVERCVPERSISWCGRVAAAECAVTSKVPKRKLHVMYLHVGKRHGAMARYRLCDGP
mgnify:CR=1 FL=1